MRAWREHQQRGRAIATCSLCGQKVYAGQASRVVYTQPATIEHVTCPPNYKTVR